MGLRPLIYLAGPITGCSWSGATSWREEVSKRLAAYSIDTASPMRWKRYLSGENKIADEYDTHPLSTGKGIVCRDRNDVKRCDAVLMYLSGAEKVSIGTMIEVGWADAFGKPLIVVMEEPRGVYDQINEAHHTIKNPHEHGMVTTLASFVVQDLDVAIDEIIPAIVLNDQHLVNIEPARNSWTVKVDPITFGADSPKPGLVTTAGGQLVDNSVIRDGSVLTGNRWD